jgi:two-component system, NtrC family, response regulator AtoC
LLTLADLGSSNGSRIAGQSLRLGEPATFEPGVVVELGSVVLMVQLPEGRAPDSKANSALGTPMSRLLRNVDMVSKSPLSVLIRSEPGAGQDTLAARVHAQSGRTTPLVRLACGAASLDRRLLTQAQCGTLFLDKVSELPLAAQAEVDGLLDVVERDPRADVRIVSSSDVDLRDRVSQGAFLERLILRLEGYVASIPPLRERRSELVGLAKTFIAESCKALKRPPLLLLPSAAEALNAYPWPGNLRELRTILARAVTLSSGTSLRAEDLQLSEAKEHVPLGAQALTVNESAEPDDQVRVAIMRALVETGGNQKRAAHVLGISVRTLQYRMDALGMQRPRKPTP